MTTINAVNGNANGGSISTMPPPSIAKESVSQTKAAIVTHQNSRFVFKRAVKQDAKLRLALSGPGGSGKTFTLLKIATALGGRIAFVDTEHGSASKYADNFQFDVIELDTFDPGIVPALIADVAAQGYNTLILDSWSHFWMGTGGELDQVDKATARSKSNNSWAAWREVSPKHTKMVDAILSAPLHVLVSMRVKTEWVVEFDEKTKKSAPRKIGLAPVMKDGVEYEFDVCGDMDVNNTLIVTKSRCSALNGQVIEKPGLEMAETLRQWLNTPAPKEPTRAPSAVETPHVRRYWNTRGEMKRLFAALREPLGERLYLEVLNNFGVTDPEQFTVTETAMDCYEVLFGLSKSEVA